MRTSVSPSVAAGSPDACRMKASTAGMCGGPLFCSKPSGTGADVDILPSRRPTVMTCKDMTLDL